MLQLIGDKTNLLPTTQKLRGCISPSFPTEDKACSSCAGEAKVLPVWNCGVGPLGSSQPSLPSLRSLCKSEHRRRTRTFCMRCALCPFERAARNSSRSEKKKIQRVGETLSHAGFKKLK